VCERLFERPPRRVLIVMLSALGDAVHVLPVLNAMKRVWPDTKIDWIIQPVPHKLVSGHPAVDDFYIFHRRRGARAVQSYADLKRQLKGKRWDLLINLQVYFKAGLITAMADADVKLGFDRARARDLNWLFTTHRIPPRSPQHVQDQYFEFIEYLGIDPQPVEWQLDLTESERSAQQQFYAGRGRTCAIVVGTSRPEKNWLPERYAKVVDALVRDYGLEPILVGGPSPVERQLAAAISAACETEPVNALGDDVRRLVWLLDGADLVISPDTGPLHIARALDRPAVGLYGFTNPKRYGPYRKYEELVVDGYARYPGEEYPLSHQHRPEGMGRITVEMVLEKVDRAAHLLAGTGGV